MGKRNKSRRFVQRGKDVVTQHSLKIPYRMTLAEAEERNSAQHQL
ncbi:competence protein [Peribacillus sp. SCS-26]